MASKKKVEVELIFDSKGAITGIKNAEGELLDLDKAANKNVKSMAQLSTAMKIGIAGAALAMAAAARKGFQVLSESVELAGVQQIAERKLEQALLNTGDASEESANQLKKLASEVQNVSNFGDEAIITAQAMLLSFSEVSGAEGAALLTSRLADVAAGVADANGTNNRVECCCCCSRQRPSVVVLERSKSTAYPYLNLKKSSSTRSRAWRKYAFLLRY